MKIAVEKSQVDELLSYLPEYHQDEVIADIKTNTVSQFIQLCKVNGVYIPDNLFEFFFEA